jgi:hypothetical protein
MDKIQFNNINGKEIDKIDLTSKTTTSLPLRNFNEQK